jgi:hypothetical protein
MRRRKVGVISRKGARLSLNGGWHTDTLVVRPPVSRPLARSSATPSPRQTPSVAGVRHRPETLPVRGVSHRFRTPAPLRGVSRRPTQPSPVFLLCSFLSRICRYQRFSGCSISFTCHNIAHTCHNISFTCHSLTHPCHNKDYTCCYMGILVVIWVYLLLYGSYLL